MPLPLGIKRVFSVDGGFLADAANNILGFTFNGIDRFFLNKQGTSTNDNSDAGDIGEYQSITVGAGDAVAATTATPLNVTSLSLTAGDWDVSGTVNRALTGTTATQYVASISPTSNTVPSQAGGSGVAADSSVIENATFGTTVTGNYITAVGARVSIAATTTIYLVASATFSAGTVAVYGTLRARRVAH